MPATYRYEIAKTGRAGCQNSACKKQGIKIDKGELRFGSLVQIRDHDSWMWKHWGCVTPAQIEKVVEQIGGLDGLDLESDLDILDGYDEVPDWAQAKIQFALKNGHVEDEDWKGDPELNRPGMKGINKRKKKKKTDAEEDEDESEPATPKPKKKSSKNREVKSEDAEERLPTPVKKKPSNKKRKVIDNDEQDELALDEEQPKKRRAPKGRKTADEEVVKDEDIDIDVAEVPDKPTKKAAKSSKKVKVEAKVATRTEHPKKVSKTSKRAAATIKEEDVGGGNMDSDDQLNTSTTTKPAKPSKTTKKQKVKEEYDATATSAGSRKRKSKS